jgi:hypothetical protein
VLLNYFVVCISIIYQYCFLNPTSLVSWLDEHVVPEEKQNLLLTYRSDADKSIQNHPKMAYQFGCINVDMIESVWLLAVKFD